MNKEEEIFTGYCLEKNHPNKLEYFCKNHNQLCCAACISKLNTIGDGQHKDCEVCITRDIKDLKKNKLKENLKLLEKLEIEYIEKISEMKKLLEIAEKDRDNLKLKVQSIFTMIRNTINDREDEILSEIDNTFKNTYFNEKFINVLYNI